MKLTAETFEQLVSSLKAQRCSDSAGRKTPRVGLSVTASMIAVQGAGVPPERFTVHIRDLSVEGISFIHQAAMRQGRPFVMELPRTIGPAIKVLCIVRHCRMVGTNLYNIGAVFRQSLTNDPAEHAAASKTA
jgi:hypothetical protein